MAGHDAADLASAAEDGAELGGAELVEGHDEVIAADEDAGVVREGAQAGVGVAVAGGHDLDDGGGGAPDGLVSCGDAETGESAVQEGAVDGVDAALKPLQPAGGLDDLADAPVGVRHLRPLHVWDRRRGLHWPHVGPDDASKLLGGVGGQLHFVLEITLGGLRWHVDAVAIDVELPAVVDAAQPGLLIATEEEAGAAVRAVVADHADGAGGVAEGDEVLAEEA